MKRRRDDVIPSLMDVLSQAVEKAGKDHIDLRPLTRGVNGKALSDKQIKRYLAGTHYPTGSGIDSWARVVAKATGEKDRLAYWRRAIDAAEEAGRAARAEQAAREAGAASRKAPSKKPRTRRSTGT